MSAILTIPALTALGSTQSSVNKFPTSFRLNIAKEHTILGLLDVMRQVAGNMGGSLEPTFKEGLPNLYCGIVSVFLMFLYLMAKEVRLRDKICAVGLLLFFNVSFIIRQLDYIWHGFHFTNMIPYRFSFLYSFVVLFMAYRAWTLRRTFGSKRIVLAESCQRGAGLLQSAYRDCSTGAFGREWNIHLYFIYNLIFLVLYLLAMLAGSITRRLLRSNAQGNCPDSVGGSPAVSPFPSPDSGDYGGGADGQPDLLRPVLSGHRGLQLSQGHGKDGLRHPLYEGAGEK